MQSLATFMYELPDRFSLSPYIYKTERKDINQTTKQGVIQINPLNQCTCTMQCPYRILFSRTALCMLYVVNNRFISFINYSAKVILLRIFSK